MKYVSKMIAAWLFVAVSLSATMTQAQPYEIKHEVINASGWFGGDDRPGFSPRQVGVGQSVLIDRPMMVQSFSLHFTDRFDFDNNPAGKGHQVTLRMHVRDANGDIIRALETVVPETFDGGWVTWDGIDIAVEAGTTLIFTTYLVGASDSLQVSTGNSADADSGFVNGQRYTATGTSDKEMELWENWSEHPWDAAFRLTGELLEVAESRFDTINAYGWFGGDDRPGFSPRHVGVGQSVLIPTSMTLSRFSFYFRGPFNSASNPSDPGREVTLTLNIRDEAGNILKTLKTDVYAAFQSGWVTWNNIELDVADSTVLIFTAYLNGAADSVQVTASNGADSEAGYADGVRFVKVGGSDADMEAWTEWAEHPWDSAFWLAGYAGTTPVEIIHAPTPESFALHQNYPNPFNPETRIRFDLTKPGKVELAIYDLTGRQVRLLLSESRAAGTYSVTWDGRDDQGKLVPSGIYFYRLKVGDAVQTRRMVFLQ